MQRSNEATLDKVVPLMAWRGSCGSRVLVPSGIQFPQNFSRIISGWRLEHRNDTQFAVLISKHLKGRSRERVRSSRKFPTSYLAIGPHVRSQRFPGIQNSCSILGESWISGYKKKTMQSVPPATVMVPKSLCHVHCTMPWRPNTKMYCPMISRQLIHACLVFDKNRCGRRFSSHHITLLMI